MKWGERANKESQTEWTQKIIITECWKNILECLGNKWDVKVELKNTLNLRMLRKLVKREVINTMRTLKNIMAGGLNGIIGETLKYGWSLHTACLMRVKLAPVPNNWKNAVILYRKKYNKSNTPKYINC